MKRVIITNEKKSKNLVKLHRISQSWISELEFVFDEHHFFQDLILKYFVDLLQDTLLDKVRRIEEEIEDKTKRGNLLLLEIRMHEKKLATLLESKHLKGEIEFRKMHKQLTDKFNLFVKANRALKRNVFVIIKEVILQHKKKRLLPHSN